MRETVKSFNMRLTLFVIGLLLVIICIVVADANRRRRGQGTGGGRKRRGWGGGGGSRRGLGGRGWGRGRRGSRRNHSPSRRYFQPVDGNWASWSNYDECSSTCGVGTQKRYRFCNNPASENHGRRCIGRNQEKRYCNRCPCPDPCESVKCLNGGICVRGICECTSEYSGPDCGVDSCNNRCLNNATCNNGICDCPQMFSGEDCGTKLAPVDLCDNVTCLNDVQICVAGICKCRPGYDRDDCSINLCKLPSVSFTRCVPLLAPSGYTCSCVLRTEVYFQNDIDYSLYKDVSVVTPIKQYDSNQNVITNIPGVTGKNLTISFIDDFLLSTCSLDYLVIGGTRYCGFSAPADIMLSTGNGTQVRFVTDRTIGFIGFTLTYQYIDAVPDSNPCKNGGTPTTQQTCNCMEGFGGNNCEFPAILTSGGKYNRIQNTTFTLPASPGKDLVLTFGDDFSIETTGGNCNDILRTDCMEDYVEIEGKRYCGGVAPEPITIPTGNGTTIRFVSNNDQEVCQAGFTLTHVYIDP
ncbi:neurogenic locus notch homolog protein 1 isoform X2 [Patella vulgata]|uniref:neurogenic locus notch homolog protein 1 isoform X2 n=1 Tax=Patella vulgata TaxID=6465 RepID=UPI0021804C87|nr:neurogenic locus notch homolog protein 1 isoform X2 [Patella vulgata]